MNETADPAAIRERARNLVDEMRRAAVAREESQTQAVQFIAEQTERLDRSEDRVRALVAEGDELRARLDATMAGARAADEAAVAAIEEERRRSAEAQERTVTGARAELARLTEMLNAFKTQSAARADELERRVARLSQANDRLVEENLALSQTAQSLVSAMEEAAQVLARQDAMVAEAIGAPPASPAREGVLLMLPNRRAPEVAPAA